jgi:hypothetical protein
MTRILEDVSSDDRVLIDGIEKGTVAILQIVMVVAEMFYLSTKLALVALAPVPFLAGGALWYTLTVHLRYRLHRHAASVMNSLLHDNLFGIRQIKVLCANLRKIVASTKKVTSCGEPPSSSRGCGHYTIPQCICSDRSECCWWWPWGRAIFYQALSNWGILGPFLCLRVFSTSTGETA